MDSERKHNLAKQKLEGKLSNAWKNLSNLRKKREATFSARQQKRNRTLENIQNLRRKQERKLTREFHKDFKKKIKLNEKSIAGNSELEKVFSRVWTIGCQSEGNGRSQNEGIC